MYFVRIGLLFFLYVRNIAFQISHIYSENKKNPNDPWNENVRMFVQLLLL